MTEVAVGEGRRGASGADAPPEASSRGSFPPPGSVDLAVLGDRVHERAAEVAATVVAAVARGRTADEALDRVADTVSSNSQLATELIGRYLATAKGAGRAQRQRLAATAQLPAGEQLSLPTLAKCYLGWRDATVNVLVEEGARLSVDSDALDRAVRIVRQSCDASLIDMVREFDAQQRELRQGLEGERAKLAHLSSHDSLTGLANRTLLMQRLEHACVRAKRSAGRPGVLFLDLDSFKAVNDSLGHEAGDQMLITVAETLTRQVRPSDTVARLGGDEFVILSEDLIDGETELAALATRVQASVASCRPPQGKLASSVSIGAALYTAGITPEQLLAQADAAMYATKHRNRRRLAANNPVKLR